MGFHSMLAEIAVCFRRSDEIELTARLCKTLASVVGREAEVPLDELQAGLTPKDRDTGHSAHNVLVVVLGPQWLDVLTAAKNTHERDVIAEEMSKCIERGAALILVRIGSMNRLLAWPAEVELAGRVYNLRKYLKLDVTAENFETDISLLAEAIATVNARTREALKRSVFRRQRARAIRAAGFGGGAIAVLIALFLFTPAGHFVWSLVEPYRGEKTPARGSRPLPAAEPVDIAAGMPPAEILKSCHEFAASPYDAARPEGIAGVKFEKVDPRRAVPFCQRALDQAPENVTVIFELARALQAASKGDGPELDRAVTLYKTAAGRGYISAMANLAVIKQETASRWHDPVGARTLLETAAASGYIPSMENLSHLYMQEENRSTDIYNKAVALMRKAAGLGSANSMVDLGDLYRDGDGVPEDKVRAAEWYEKAANLGSGTAMRRLGAAYNEGDGVLKDPVKARDWYRKSYETGDVWGAYTLAYMLENGEGGEKDYANALELYKFAAERDNTWAMINLGNMYERGEGTPIDYALAMKWYQAAYDHGQWRGPTNIGSLYENGLGVKKSYAKAIEYYQKAAEMGDPLAMENLGWLYASKKPADYDKAYRWLSKAAAEDRSSAINRLALLYSNGSGVPKNEAKAAELWERAVKLGSTAAMSNLGNALIYGLGIPRDEARGRKLLEEAADKGDEWAIEYLKKLQTLTSAPHR